MALATRNLVSYADSAINATALTYTQAYTLGLGTDWLVVPVQSEGRVTAAPPADVSAVKWNGVALTKILEQISDVDSTPEGVVVEFWGVYNPSFQGETHNITVETATAASGHDLSSMSFQILEVFGGADSVLGAIASAHHAVSTDATLSLTTLGVNSLVVATASHYDGTRGPYTPQADIVELLDGNTGASATSDHTYWLGAKVQGAAGTKAVGATSNASGNNATCAVEIKVAAAPTGLKGPLVGEGRLISKGRLAA